MTVEFAVEGDQLQLPSGLRDSAQLRKARGAFFTPPELSAYISRWALRSPADRVLEPSCGEAAFLLAAAHRLDELGAPLDPQQLTGVELHDHSAAAARRALEQAARRRCGSRTFSTCRASDTSTLSSATRRTCATRGSRARCGQRADRPRCAGGLTALASSWAAFTVHSAEFLRPGGRLGLVLPAELLTVNYAADVRRYLMRSFGRVRLVLFTERVFPGVLEEVVLLLAEDALAAGGTDHCELLQVTSAADLARQLDSTLPAHVWRPVDTGAKWTPALLSASALEVYAPVVSDAGFTGLQSWGETTLGSVTGRNDYFALSPAQAEELGLYDDELVPLSPPGSRHLRGLSFTTEGWRRLVLQPQLG